MQHPVSQWALAENENDERMKLAREQTINIAKRRHFHLAETATFPQILMKVHALCISFHVKWMCHVCCLALCRTALSHQLTLPHGTKKPRDFARQLIFNRCRNLDSTQPAKCTLRMWARHYSSRVNRTKKEKREKKTKPLCSTVTYGRRPSRNQTDAFHYHTPKVAAGREFQLLARIHEYHLCVGVHARENPLGAWRTTLGN